MTRSQRVCFMIFLAVLTVNLFALSVACFFDGLHATGGIYLLTDFCCVVFSSITFKREKKHREGERNSYSEKEVIEEIRERRS